MEITCPICEGIDPDNLEEMIRRHEAAGDRVRGEV